MIRGENRTMLTGMAKLLALIMSLTMVVPLAGCSNSKKMQEYNQGLAESSTAITAAYAEFTAAIQGFGEGYSEEKRQAVLDAVASMEAGYNQLGGLEPPDKYSDVQVCYKEAASLFAQAAAVYREEFENVTADTVDEAFLERVKVGDEYAKQAQEKVMEGSAKGQEIENGR